MSNRPIIFSAPMVRALLDGRKTQTRRLATSPLRRCEIGDRLYVREAYTVAGIFSDVVETRYRASERRGHTEFVEQVPIDCATGAKMLWPAFRPSLHMPRWASRLTLIVEAVRVEPLQAITDADAEAEGVREPSLWPDQEAGQPWPPIPAYRALWNTLHKDPGQRWQDNPGVLVITFCVVRGNIDREAA